MEDNTPTVVLYFSLPSRFLTEAAQVILPWCWFANISGVRGHLLAGKLTSL